MLSAVPRPNPARIWYPIHFPSLVSFSKVTMRPDPMAVTMLPRMAQGGM